MKTVHEDELPNMTDEEYSAWFDKSWIEDGVRVGPEVPIPEPVEVDGRVET